MKILTANIFLNPRKIETYFCLLIFDTGEAAKCGHQLITIPESNPYLSRFKSFGIVYFNS